VIVGHHSNYTEIRGLTEDQLRRLIPPQPGPPPRDWWLALVLLSLVVGIAIGASL
jgi:hypothetical protein